MASKKDANAQGQDSGTVPAPGSQPAGSPEGGNETQGQGNQSQDNQDPQNGDSSSPLEGQENNSSKTNPDLSGDDRTNAQGQDSGKIKIAHEDLKNGKILLSDGSLAKFNAEGIAEIEAGEATRLLSIPGYKKV
jgi:hypothetical protein